MSPTTPRASMSRRLFATMAATVAAVTLAIAPLHTPPASAAPGEIPPDSSLFVAEKGHVDSPKVFYKDGHLSLETEAKGETRPIDTAIHNLGHGYTRDGKQNFIFTVPKNAPELDFLGKPGTDLFMSPMISNLPHDPIWAGFGADTGVPIENFRDGAFTLDLVEVKGPGRVEQFRWSPGGEGESGYLTRMLSSSDPRYRSALLTAGTHTHNYTTFSRPGRYELTYRASARTKSGALLATKEYTTQWQVGGNRPGAAMTSIAEKTPSQAKRGLTISPATGVEGKDSAVEGKLHTLEVRTPEVEKGTAEFTVNGFHLATVGLSHGYAGFHELLPADASRYQVNVRDESGTLRYTSAPLSLKDGKASTGESADPLAPHAEKSEKFGAKELSIGSRRVSATFAPASNGTHALTMTVDDPQFTGFVSLGQYSSEKDDLPNTTFDTAIRGGKATLSVPSSYLDNGDALKVSLTPHPLVRNAKKTSVTLAPSFNARDTFKKTFELSPDGATSPGDDQPQPDPSQPSDPPTPGEAPTCRDRLLIDHGHLDLALQGDGSGVSSTIKDDSRIGAKNTVDRDGGEIALVVNDAAKEARTKAQAGKEWDGILAPVGTPTWVLPFSQNPSLPWPGYSTERVKEGDFSSYELTLEKVTGPGDVSLFVPDGLGGKPRTLLASRKGAPRSLPIEGPTHAHTAWAFTKPGTYTLTFTYKAVKPDGTTVTSNPQTLTILVGKNAKDEFCSAATLEP
ncbi:MAG: choice-of-anchor M domain-containing protein [Dermabacter sp.]|nr:choice-of-anchor M domain-containing protein [Dermabacter sp.]